jgi:hypothetical protein
MRQELLDRASEDKIFPKKIITGDETCVYGYDVETKVPSSQWVGKNPPRLKKSRRVRSNVKVMLTIFFYIESVVHHKFLRQGKTMNCWYYLEMLKRIRENVRRTRPQLRINNSWFLHHDNAPAHASLLIPGFLANTNTTTHVTWLQQTFSFPKQKFTLKGRRFRTIQEITEKSQTDLSAIPEKL